MIRRAGLTLLAAAIVALMMAPTPALAQEGKSVIRYYLGYVTPSSDYKETVEGTGEVIARLQQSLGVGLGYEYMFTDTIGVDVSAKYFKPEFRVLAPGYDRQKRMRFFPVTVGPMYHFGTERYHFYAGPELAYVAWGKISAPDDISIKSELTFGAKFGVDIPWSERWAFNATFEYLHAKARVDVPDGPDLKPHPLIVTLGATYHF